MSLWSIMKSPLVITADINMTTMTKARLEIMRNVEVARVCKDPLGVQGRRIWSSTNSTSAMFGEMLDTDKKSAQAFLHNVIASPCDTNDLGQQWVTTASGLLAVRSMGHCLLLDSGDITNPGCQSGKGSRFLNIGTLECSTVLDAHCDIGVWAYHTANYSITQTSTGLCLTLDPIGRHRVGVAPCGSELETFQIWIQNTKTKQFVAALGRARNGRKTCLAVVHAVPPGALEVWASALSEGKYAVALINRLETRPMRINVTWAQLAQLTGPGGEHLNRTMYRAYHVRDLWQKKDFGEYQVGYYVNVAPEQVVLVELSPLKPDVQKEAKCKGEKKFSSIFVDVRVRLDVAAWRELESVFISTVAKNLNMPEGSLSEQKMLKFGEILAVKYKMYVLKADAETVIDFLHTSWFQKRTMQALFGTNSALHKYFVLSAMSARPKPKPKLHGSSIFSTWAKTHPAQAAARNLPVPADAQLSMMNQGLSLLVDFGLGVYAKPRQGVAEASHFTPILVRTDQWVRSAAEMGLAEVCLTVMHKDGFILWASEFTDFSVMYSPCK
jgi:hypothetical protein